MEAAIVLSLDGQQQQASIRYDAYDGDDGLDEEYDRDLEAVIRLSMKDW